MRRNWTEVGAEYVERLGGREDVEQGIRELDWEDIPPAGKLTVGFLPGVAINEAIAQLALPRVAKVAISAFDRPAASPEEDGFYPGFYGIECSYGDGLARVYVLDPGGNELTPLASDFYERDGGEIERDEKAGTEIWKLVEAATV